MTDNAREQAVNEALKVSRYLGEVFARIGNSDHPRGFVPTAYRNARRAMRSVLQEKNSNPSTAAEEVMSQLKETVRADLAVMLPEVQDYGIAYAKKQLEIYGINSASDTSTDLGSQFYSGSSAVLSIIQHQADVAKYMLAVGVDADLILGDEDRVGILRPGDVISAATFWSSALLWSAFEGFVRQASKDPGNLKKIVVAAVDGDTTDCCLQANGQVQPFDKPFKLTGTPRFADELQGTPFHRYCRTSIALYQENFNNGITNEMRRSVATILEKK